MAHKKLKLEVELETAKAKRQAKAIADAGDAGGGGAAGVRALPGMEKSLGKAAKGLDELGDKSKACTNQIAGVVRSFAGIGVGMAANYAARYMAAGKARDAVQMGAGGLQGASVANAAAMALPGGPLVKGIVTAIGAGLGVAKVRTEQVGERRKATEAFERGEKDYASAKAFAERLRELTGANGERGETGGKGERLAAAKAELEQYKAVEGKLAENTRAFIAKGDMENAQAQQGYLGENRSRQAQLEAAIRSMEAVKAPDLSRDYRTGADALNRVGGAFAGGGGARTDEVLGRKADETNRLLREIAAKKGGATWA